MKFEDTLRFFARLRWVFGRFFLQRKINFFLYKFSMLVKLVFIEGRMTYPSVVLSLTLPPLGFLDVDDTGGGVNVTHTL